MNQERNCSNQLISWFILFPKLEFSSILRQGGLKFEDSETKIKRRDNKEGKDKGDGKRKYYRA